MDGKIPTMPRAERAYGGCISPCRGDAAGPAVEEEVAWDRLLQWYIDLELAPMVQIQLGGPRKVTARLLCSNIYPDNISCFKDICW